MMTIQVNCSLSSIMPARTLASRPALRNASSTACTSSGLAHLSIWTCSCRSCMVSFWSGFVAEGGETHSFDLFRVKAKPP